MEGTGSEVFILDAKLVINDCYTYSVQLASWTVCWNVDFFLCTNNIFDL